MRHLEKLQQLVRAMDKSEKRYFRLAQTALGKKDGQLLELFDLLQEMPEDGSFAQNDGLDFSGLNSNLPTLTRRLLDRISAAMSLKYSGKTIESRLHFALETIRLLYQKKQWALAAWKLHKEKRIALRFSYLPEFLSLLKWERKVLLARVPNDALSRMEVLRTQEQDVLNLLTRQAELQHMDYLTRHLIRLRRHADEPTQLEKLKDIATSGMVQAGLSSQDFLSFSYASNIYGNYLNVQQDYPRAIQVYAKVFDAWRQDPAWIREHPVFFLSLFSNYQIALLHGSRDLATLEDCQLFMRKVRLPDPAVQLIFRNISYQSGIVLYMNNGKFGDALALYAEIERWLSANAKDLSDNVHLTFHYNAAAIHLMQESFAEGLRCIRRINSFPATTARKDIREVARLLYVMMNWEMGENEYAEQILHTTYQHFRKHSYTELYRATVDLMRKLLRQPPGADARPLFTAYLSVLEQIREAVGVSLPFGFMELWIWASGRARKLPLSDVFREVAGQ